MIREYFNRILGLDDARKTPVEAEISHGSMPVTNGVTVTRGRTNTFEIYVPAGTVYVETKGFNGHINWMSSDNVTRVHVDPVTRDLIIDRDTVDGFETTARVAAGVWASYVYTPKVKDKSCETQPTETTP